MTHPNSSASLELWLLHRCAEGIPDVSLVVMSPQMLRQQWADFETDMSTWNRSAICHGLVSIAERQEIRFFVDAECERCSRTARAAKVYLPPGEVASVIQEHSIIPGQKYWYEFGRAGITRWSTHFRPDWRKYWRSRHYTFSNGESGVVLVCGSERQRSIVLTLFGEYYGADAEFGLQRVKIGIRSQWAATYWKTLPKGFFASFRYREKLDLAPTVAEEMQSALFNWTRGL